LELILAEGAFFRKGEILFAGRQVDAKTGTILITALFPNPGNICGRPVRSSARADPDRKGALLVPQRSVTELQEASRWRWWGRQQGRHSARQSRERWAAVVIDSD